MTPDEERWAEALAVERIHGANAPVHVESRIAELAAAGDNDGVARWREIGRRLNTLTGSPPSAGHS